MLIRACTIQLFNQQLNRDFESVSSRPRNYALGLFIKRLTNRFVSFPRDFYSASLSLRETVPFFAHPKIHACKIYLAHACAWGRLTSGIRDDSGTEIYSIDEQKTRSAENYVPFFHLDPSNAARFSLN